MMMRSLGATLPPRPNAVAGMMHGATASAAVRFRKARRETFDPAMGFVEMLFCDMRSLLNIAHYWVGFSPPILHKKSQGQ